MDGGDAAGGGGASADNMIINQIMLRFRPIAPKPTGGSSGKSSPESGSGFVGVGRRKRRYVRVSGTTTTTKRSGDSSKGGTRSDSHNEVKTLRLMPDGKSHGVNNEKRSEPLDLETGDQIGRSWVKVLSLTKACMEEQGAGLGSTDEERWRNLEGDTCPGFISDGCNRVVWSNAAFRRMVVGGEGHVEVNLEVEERVRVEERCTAFSCMVRMKYTWQKGSVKTVVVPCDVWRMSDAGFAWRMDLKAGLSLSLVL